MRTGGYISVSGSSNHQWYRLNKTSVQDPDMRLQENNMEESWYHSATVELLIWPMDVKAAPWW